MTDTPATATAADATNHVLLLPSELINQIAAGEVVERPASVVKELLENSIDAGARSIDISLIDGGRKLIEVSDDGCGMSPADAALSLERHATSKIRAFDDLLSVMTLGFRGEALPSIASISRFTLLTSHNDRGEAWEIHCEPSLPPQPRPAARDRGTTVRVRDLFENVPARRKFLKSSDAEMRAIAATVSAYALARPSHSFRLSHNDRLLIDLPSAASPRERALQVIGAEADPHLVEIEGEFDGVRASGFATRGLRYASRRNQYYFVNGRMVRDRVLSHAVARATDTFDESGHPAIVLFVELDPRGVDVNVHPAKTEVRFRDSGRVHVVVEQSVKRALGGAAGGSALLRESGSDRATLAIGLPPLPDRIEPVAGFVPIDQPATRIAYEVTPLFQQRPVVQPPGPTTADLGDLRGRVIGQYRSSYVLVDTPEGLRLIDQHAAHERVLYERVLRRDAIAMSQHLLQPYVHSCGAGEAALLDSYLGDLRELGFDIEPFSRNSFAIAAVPALLLREPIESFLRKLLDGAADDHSHAAAVRDRIAATVACHAAIKVHRPLDGREMAQLISDLFACNTPYACAHGRPTVIDIPQIDIERHFHRR